jgi:hypothetical protein
MTTAEIIHWNSNNHLGIRYANLAPPPQPQPVTIRPVETTIPTRFVTDEVQHTLIERRGRWALYKLERPGCVAVYRVFLVCAVAGGEGLWGRGAWNSRNPYPKDAKNEVTTERDGLAWLDRVASRTE